MAHIHEKIDFTVAIFVVRDGQVLLIHHRKLDQWLPLGGHIELDEDPETAALREAKEESGLEVEPVGERPPTTGPGTRALIAPRFLVYHRETINEHQFYPAMAGVCVLLVLLGAAVWTAIERIIARGYGDSLPAWPACVHNETR